MRTIQGFPYAAGADAAVLILGSMPSEISLLEQQYYANRQNLFWKFAEILFGIARELPYEERLARLNQARVALWDVAFRCKREGSLDADIEPGSVVPNDFRAFFQAFSGVHSVFFNGRKAEQLYHRLVVPELEEPWQRLRYQELPSTSPANASIPRAEKLRRWRAVKAALEITPTGGRN